MLKGLLTTVLTTAFYLSESVYVNARFLHYFQVVYMLGRVAFMSVLITNNWKCSYI